MLEDGDLVYIGPTGAAAVFNVASLTTNTIAAHSNINELAVVREERKIEANVESIMKVWPWCGGEEGVGLRAVGWGAMLWQLRACDGARSGRKI